MRGVPFPPALPPSPLLTWSSKTGLFFQRGRPFDRDHRGVASYLYFNIFFGLPFFPPSARWYRCFFPPPPTVLRSHFFPSQRQLMNFFLPLEKACIAPSPRKPRPSRHQEAQRAPSMGEDTPASRRSLPGRTEHRPLTLRPSPFPCKLCAQTDPAHPFLARGGFPF